MLGLIIYNLQFKENPIWKQQIQDYCDSFFKEGIRLVPMDHVSAYMNVLQNKVKPNFVLFYDKEIELAKLFENHGAIVFNPPEAIENADDKAKTFVCLDKIGVPTLPTYIIPNFYYGSIKEYIKEIEFCLESTGITFPAVLKSRCSSLGEGVSIIPSLEALEIFLTKNISERFIIQKYIEPSRMTGAIDYRVIVVGGTVVCCFKRTNLSDFRCNSQYGAKWQEIKLAPGNIKMKSLKVAKKMKLSFCAIDFINDNGKYCVIDVNSNMLTKQATETSGTSITDSVAKYIAKKVS